MKKTKITVEEVKHIARLAKLSFTDEGLKKITGELSETVDFIERIKKIPTEGLKPTSHVTGEENVFREDEIKPSLTQEEALSAAFGAYKGYFKVKAILE